MNQNFSFTYINSFDGLRAFATLAVLGLHGSYGIIRGGWIGVDLFFVLSGFLITSLLQAEFVKTGRISLSHFYLRRFLRLFPALLICILLANMLWQFTPLFVGENRSWATAGALFYFTNLLGANVGGNMAHLWSLSVEEHFYFFWPVLALFFLFQASNKVRIRFLAFLFAAVCLLRIMVFNYQGMFDFGLFTVNANRFTFCKIDSIVLGAMLAFLSFKRILQKNEEVNAKQSTGIIALLLFVFAIVLFTLDEDNLFWRNGGFILTDLLCVYTVYIAIMYPNNFLLSNSAMTWLGKRSYGIYLYHFPVFLFLENFRQPHDATNFFVVSVVKFSVSIFLAALSYSYVEQPILRLKNHLQSRRITEKTLATS